MAFSSTQLDIASNFDFTLSPKSFTITDNTDYSAETYSEIYGIVQVLGPTGSQIYNNVDFNDPDVDYNASTTSGTLAPLPLTDSKVQKGIYQFNYKAKLVAMLQQHVIVSNNSAAKTFVISGNYASQILDGTATDFEVIDSGTTAVTIVTATYSSGFTTVTIAETLGVLTPTAEFQFTVDVVFEKSFQQDFQYESPSVCISIEEGECSDLTFSDLTTYPTGATVTRLHTISYPKGISPAPADVESPLQTLVISPIWTGTWVDIFTAEVSASLGIINITDELSGTKEHKVVADSALCQVYACMAALTNKFVSYATSNPQKAQEMALAINQASAALWAYTIGKKCGKDGYENFLSIITKITADCGCDCGCSDCAEGPVQVVGCCQNVGYSDFTILIPSSTSLTSVSNTVGSTTTFTIEVKDAWLSNQFNTLFAAKSIGGLSDVNTGNISPAAQQVLVWSTGSQKWVRGLPQLNLTQLLDVDDSSLADNKILYYDAGSETFKFKLATDASIATLTDVVLTSVANGDILKYNGTNWINVDNFLSLLGDVNTTGRVDGSALGWDTGTSKWIIFTPKKTFASLDDVEIGFTTPLANNDRVQYVTGTGWVNLALPDFTDALVTYPPGYTGAVSGIAEFGYRYDKITDDVTIRGGINVSGASGVATVIATLPAGVYPLFEVPFICTVGYGATNYLAFGNISTGGVITIFNYIDNTGAQQPGFPAGDIAFSTPIIYKLT